MTRKSHIDQARQALLSAGEMTLSAIRSMASAERPKLNEELQRIAELLYTHAEYVNGMHRAEKDDSEMGK